jgi:hypothetical protein
MTVLSNEIPPNKPFAGERAQVRTEVHRGGAPAPGADRTAGNRDVAAEREGAGQQGLDSALRQHQQNDFRSLRAGLKPETAGTHRIESRIASFTGLVVFDEEHAAPPFSAE